MKRHSPRVHIVANLWGWTLPGILTWIRFGWGLFPVWGIQNADGPGLHRRCSKLGPVAWSWPSASPNVRARLPAAMLAVSFALAVVSFLVCGG